MNKIRNATNFYSGHNLCMGGFSCMDDCYGLIMNMRLWFLYHKVMLIINERLLVNEG